MTIGLETERQRMEEIYKLTSILLENKENSIKELLKAACKLFDAELGLICLMKGGNYSIKECYSETPVIVDKSKFFKVEGTICSETLKQNKLLAIPNTADPKYADFDLNGIIYVKSYIGIPVIFDNKEVGTISFSSSKIKQKGYSDKELDLMMYLNQWISHHLNRAFYKESLNDQNIELEKKNKKLEAIMEENNQLMQILVHDLKSPLSNIKMLSYLFQDFAQNPESEELLGIFNKSLEYVFHLIEQMETLNSVENFPLNNYLESFDLNLFVKEIVKDFTNSAQSKSIKLNYDFMGKSAVVKTDMNFLKRILHNLMSNALKFSAFEKQIFVSLIQQPNHYEIRIKDEGPGISLEEQTKLFGKFTKLTNQPTNSESSSGLGLFIVKELLKNLKGSISLESEVGKGATFIVQLPVEI